MTWFIVYRAVEGEAPIDNLSFVPGEDLPVPDWLPIPEGHAVIATEHGHEVGRKTHVVVGHPHYPFIAPKDAE